MKHKFFSQNGILGGTGAISGFTLLELMVSVALLGMISVAATLLFFSAIRGGGKVSVVTEVKQNGQFALNSMEQLIRNAASLESCSAEAMTFIDKDGGNLGYECKDVDPDLDTGYIAKNAARLTSAEVAVTECVFTCDVDPNRLRGPLINISFTVKKAGTSGDVADEASANFSTAVSVRSY